jgi:DNA polymerase-3 subunit delta'
MSSSPFDGIAGHRAALDLLQHQVDSGRTPHAYLFAGEPMLGKTTAARALAGALLPDLPLARHPDYWEDDRSDALRIDEIRLLPDRQPEFHQQSLQAFLSMKPALGSHRVAVISNVGRLADPVQGILLKTLEEPHPGRVIVLTTPSLSPFVVLPTVVSRCQRVAFHGVGQHDVEALLGRRGVPTATATLLAELARGRPGWAVRAAGDETVIERHREWSDRFDQVVGAPADAALHLAAALDAAAWEWRRNGKGQPAGERGEDPLAFAMAAWQLHLRRRMVDEGHPPSQARWAHLLERSYDVVGYLEQNVSPRLALEVFLLEASRAG